MRRRDRKMNRCNAGRVVVMEAEGAEAVGRGGGGDRRMLSRNDRMIVRRAERLSQQQNCGCCRRDSAPPNGARSNDLSVHYSAGGVTIHGNRIDLIKRAASAALGQATSLRSAKRNDGRGGAYARDRNARDRAAPRRRSSRTSAPNRAAISCGTRLPDWWPHIGRASSQVFSGWCLQSVCDNRSTLADSPGVAVFASFGHRSSPFSNGFAASGRQFDDS